MLQTFGSWYGFKFPVDVNAGAPSEKNNWRGLKCECGENKFERYGKIYREAVYMTPDGRWQIREDAISRGSPPTEFCKRVNSQSEKEN